jgi:hypothetical protein
MNVLFDKAMYEKGRSLDSKSDKLVDEKDEGKAIEKAIKESLASGKVGSLSVDPNFLDFEPLGSESRYWQFPVTSDNSDTFHLNF